MSNQLLLRFPSFLTQNPRTFGASGLGQDDKSWDPGTSPQSITQMTLEKSHGFPFY